MITIYHNSRCKISRLVLEKLKSSGKEYTIIEYLKTIPSIEDIKKLLLKLNAKPIDIIRKNETIFKKQFKDKSFTDEEWLIIIHENPILIERPILENKYKSIICRPPEKFVELIK